MERECYTLELDAEVGVTLERFAARKGVSVQDCVAEMVRASVSAAEADEGERDDAALAALETSWKAIEAGEATVPHEEVRRWLATWGTQDFKPWHRQT